MLKGLSASRGSDMGTRRDAALLTAAMLSLAVSTTSSLLSAFDPSVRAALCGGVLS